MADHCDPSENVRVMENNYSTMQPSSKPVLDGRTIRPPSKVPQPFKKKLENQEGQGSKKARLELTEMVDMDAGSSVKKSVGVKRLRTKRSNGSTATNCWKMPLASLQLATPQVNNIRPAALPTNNVRPAALPTSNIRHLSPPTKPTGGKKCPAWDTKGRLEDMEQAMAKQSEQNSCLQQKILSSIKHQVSKPESMNTHLTGRIKEKKLQSSEAGGEIHLLQRKIKENEEEMEVTRSKWKRQVEELQFEKGTLEKQKATLESELSAASEELRGLKSTVSQMAATQSTLECQLSAVKTNLSKSEATICDKDEEIASLKAAINDNLKTISEQRDKIHNDETIRRKLHNTILELKGNIRVFCRVRPLINEECIGNNGDITYMRFPDDDHKVLKLEKLSDINPNESVAAFRKGSSNKCEFSFDRVFAPSSSQAEVFEEISQLVQNALDGYNVCIFAYGQTGSGKTYTMEGAIGCGEEHRGMITRAMEQVFQTADELAEKGWQYDFEVSFLEIYNETIRDLLSSGTDDIKHEIRLASSNGSEVYVTNLTVVTDRAQTLDLLRKAAQNRSVAETKCNERSSRSHSIFRIKITGKNSVSLETCYGFLNIIDLAGSERLKKSGSQGQRLKEAQNINKSLANLGNVIMALANKESHVPYRDSKLTHLLQNCLGGSSKTLMFVNVSPEEDCFEETLNSLRFATKVNDCNIGTAQKKVK